MSFFTAVFMTRVVYDYMLSKDKWTNLTFVTGYSKNLMQNAKFNFMGAYKISFAVRGLSQSIDFTGGRNYVVTLDKETHVEDVRLALTGAFVNTMGENQGKEANTSVIALGTDGKTVRISTNWDIESNNPDVDDQAETILFNALKKANLVSQENVEAFKNPDVREGGSIISSAKVGPSVAKDITYGAIISVVIALIAIFLYPAPFPQRGILCRFNGGSGTRRPRGDRLLLSALGLGTHVARDRSDLHRCYSDCDRLFYQR